MRHVIHCLFTLLALGCVSHKLAHDNDGRPNAVVTKDNKAYGHVSPVTSIEFTPDSKEIISTGFDGTIRFWDVKTQKEVKRIVKDKDFIGARFRFSPDARCAALYQQERILITDSQFAPKNRIEVGRSLDYMIGIHDVHFSDGCDSLIISASDSTIFIWKAGGNRLKQLVKPNDYGGMISVAPSGDHLSYIENQNDYTTIWTLNTLSESRDVLYRTTRNLKKFEYLDDRRLVVMTVDEKGTELRVLNTVERQFEKRLHLKNRWAHTLMLSPDRRFAVIAETCDVGNRHVMIWDIKDNRIKTTRFIDSRDCTLMAYSNDGNHIAIVAGCRIRLFNANSLAPEGIIGENCKIESRYWTL